jgi:hypothetical protein
MPQCPDAVMILHLILLYRTLCWYAVLLPVLHTSVLSVPDACCYCYYLILCQLCRLLLPYTVAAIQWIQLLIENPSSFFLLTAQR